MLRVAALAIPFLCVLTYVYWFGVDVPYYDQWTLVPFFEKAYAGDWSVADLWTQHNEHRLVFPKLVMLGLARLSQWNPALERVSSVAFAAIAFWGVCCIVPRFGPRLAIAALMCSLHQWENWMWGFQLQIFLAVAACVWTIVLTSKGRALAAIAMASIATFSFASGMLAWVLGLSMLAARRADRRDIAVWFVASAFALGAFFVDYEAPMLWASGQDPAAQLDNVLRSFGKYVGGSLVGPEHPASVAVGYFGVFAIVSLAIAALWTRDGRREHLPMVLLGVVGLTNGIGLAIGRFRHAEGGLYFPRYASLSVHVWVATLALAASAAHAFDSRTRRSFGRVAWIAATTLALLLHFATQRDAHAAASSFRQRLESARQVLITGAGDSTHFGLDEYANRYARGLGRRTLLNLGWSVFRDETIATRARDTLEPRPELVVEERGNRLHLTARRGRPGRFAGIYLLVPNGALHIASDVFDAEGTLRVILPKPEQAEGTELTWMVATLDASGAIVLGQPTKTTLERRF